MHVVGGTEAPPPHFQGSHSSTSNHASSAADSLSNLPTASAGGQILDSNGNGCSEPNGVDDQEQPVTSMEQVNGNASASEDNANRASAPGHVRARLSLSADRTRRIRSEWLADAGPSHLKVLNRCSGPTGKQSFRLQWHITQDVSESDWIALCYTAEIHFHYKDTRGKETTCLMADGDCSALLLTSRERDLPGLSSTASGKLRKVAK